MTPLLKNNCTIYYLTQNTPVQTSGQFCVILSPEFYWIKEVELPVKSVSAAKKLAESLFEGSLPSGTYAYDVSKSEKGFVLIAYDKDMISEKISETFTQDAKVSGIYFAQHEFTHLQECCGIDQYSSLINLNGLIMQVPRVCTESKKEIGSYLESITLSKHKITLNAFEDTVVEKKTVAMLAAGVALLLISNVIDWVGYANANSALEAQRSSIIAAYDLPPTSLQIKSIKDRLTKSFDTQKEIRDVLYAFNSIILKADEYIEHIEADAKVTTIVIKVMDEKRESEIKNMLAKSVKVLSSSYDNNKITLKIAS